MSGKTSRYGHWIILPEFMPVAQRTYQSALHEDDYTAAESGEMRIPYRETSKKELIKLLDRVDDRKCRENPDRDYEKYPVNYNVK